MRVRRWIPVLLLGLGLLLTPACGQEKARDPANGAGGANTPLEPLSGPVVGQEIWITYRAPEYQAYGRRTGRSREEARRVAESLRRRVLAGESIGSLAQRFSGAPGAAAQGFGGVLPVDPARPGPRARALASVEVGGVTPLIDWMGGWWFARRVGPARGRDLARLF
ncbi:MAG: peptidylprolyl isomerase, partial [Planctomycetota bacterium]